MEKGRLAGILALAVITAVTVGAEYDITQADRDALRERGIYLGQVLD